MEKELRKNAVQKYDASIDESLNKSIQFAREKIFFLCQYRKRKFITDKNVLFDEYDSEDTKNEVVAALGYSNMGHSDVDGVYRKIVESVVNIILPDTLIEYDACRGNLCEVLSEKARLIIDDLQWYSAVFIFKLFQEGICPSIANKELCKRLLESTVIAKNILGLTLISVRYGLLITDLCSYSSDMDIKNTVGKEELLQCRVFSHTSDFSPLTNPHILQEDDGLHRKRLLKFQEDAVAGKEIGRLEAAAVKKALPKIISGSFYSNSILKRRVGLWLWDQCDNPLKYDRIKIGKAIEYICALKLFNGRNINTLKRDFFRVYSVTKNCIAAGNILPIEDGNKK